MGLLHTKQYLDFLETHWKMISNNPVIFESLVDNNRLEISDSSNKTFDLNFKKGSKVRCIRVAGQFRISWDDGDLKNTSD